MKTAMIAYDVFLGAGHKKTNAQYVQRYAGTTASVSSYSTLSH